MPDLMEPASARSFGDSASGEILDLRGLKCPLPVLHTRRALTRTAAGTLLEVWTTDPLAALDIANLLRQTGDTLLVSTPGDRETRFLIRRSGAVQQGAEGAQDPSGLVSVDRFA